MAARALSAFLGRHWYAAHPDERVGALLLAEAIDHLRYLQKFAADYRKASAKAGRGRGRKGGRRRRR